MIYKSKYYARITKNDGVTTFVILPKHIVSVDQTSAVDFEQTAELITGVSQPNVSRITFTKVSQDKEPTLYNFLARDADWRMTKIEVFYSIDNGVNYSRLFEGLLFVRSEELNTVSFIARGYIDLLNITLIETPLLRNRKVATYIPPVTEGMTDAQIFALLKKQNPTIIEGSSVGIVNALLWLVGGRPYNYKKLYTEQYSGVAGEHPKFYYDCESSVVNPEWVWFNYENLLGDLTLLCKASGGLLQQNIDGLVRYTNVYNFRKYSSGITFTDSSYESLSIAELGTEPYSRIVTSYTPRYLAGSQEVYKMVLDEYLENGQELTRRVDFNKPVWKLVNKTISGQLTDTIVSLSLKDVKSNITAVDLFGTKRTVKARITPHTTLFIPKYSYAGTPGNFTKVRDNGIAGSQSTSLIISNTITGDASSLYIGDVSLFGRALEAANTETYIKELNQYPTISGFKELRIPDNPYVQDESSAKRLTYISEYLLEVPRMSIELSKVPYVSGLALGSVVTVNSSKHNINEDFKIYSMSFSETLNTMDLSLISVSGLYTENDVFIVGKTYGGSDTKILSF